MTRALALLVGALMMSGCAVLPRGFWSGEPVVMPPGRVLVIARKGPEGRGVAEAAARRFLETLRESFDVVGPAETVRRAPAAALVIERLQGDGWPTAEEGALLAALGLSSVLAVDVTGYEQAWNGDGKITRVGLIAEVYVLPAGPPVWRVFRDASLDDRRGRAFQATLDEAVANLAASIVPFKPAPRVDARPRPEGPRCC